MGRVTTAEGPTRFVHGSLPSRVVFAAGAARERLADEVARLAARRVLLIATERQARAASHLVDPLDAVVVAVFRRVRQHVPIEVADEVVALATGVDADLLLTIGGGSTTGTAKAAALRLGLPILSVPTTYAGSEVTPVWGLTEAGRKTTGVDPRVLPRTVVYDPELTLELPAGVSATSGLNAMAHCIEAFWAPGANPLTSAVAERGIRALAHGLPRVVADGRDLDARTDALLGAWLAGVSLAGAGAGLHHRICHVLGGAYDLPHAATHAIVLPHVLAFNAPAVPRAAADIAGALGVDDPAAGLAELTELLGAPTALARVGLREDDLDAATELVFERVPADNPRAVGRDDVAALLRAAWSGGHPEELT